MYVGAEMVRTMFLPMMYKLFLLKGATLTPHTSVMEISGNTIYGRNIYTNQEVVIEGVDTIVTAFEHQANDQLFQTLEGRVGEIYRIGDCVAQGKVIDAIYDGYHLSRVL